MKQKFHGLNKGISWKFLESQRVKYPKHLYNNNQDNQLILTAGYFMPKVMELHSLYFHIYLFLCSCFLKVFFSYIPIKYEWFFNRSIWSIDGILTDTITPGQRGPGNNGRERVFHTVHITRCSLVIYTGHPYFYFGGNERAPTLLQLMQPAYS